MGWKPGLQWCQDSALGVHGPSESEEVEDLLSILSVIPWHQYGSSTATAHLFPLPKQTKGAEQGGKPEQVYPSDFRGHSLWYLLERRHHLYSWALSVRHLTEFGLCTSRYKRDGFTAGTPLSIHQKNKLILL